MFLLSTALFIYQHYRFLYWDFSAYVQNARYLFYGGDYFEVYRAPLAPLLLSTFIIFGIFGEYFYITFISLLFLWSNILLSDVIFKDYHEISKETKRFIFYSFSLSPFVLYYGFLTGTELLALAFIELFFVFFIRGKVCGYFLALAFLSRYNSLLFIPFMFFYRDYKKIIKNILSFFLIIFPWFLYNYLKFGNWFTSIIDSYALNIYLRKDLIEPFSFNLFLPLIKLVWPLLFLGFFVLLLRLLRNMKSFKLDNENKIFVLFLLVIFLIFFEFINIPFKIERYLFNLSLPIAFFSSIGMIFIMGFFKKYRKIFIILLFVAFLFSFSFLIIDYRAEKNSHLIFSNAAEYINKMNLRECEVLSTHWVPLNYLTGNARPLAKDEIRGDISNNKIVLVFKKFYSYDHQFKEGELKNYPVLYEAEEYVFFAKQNLTSNNCKKVESQDSPIMKNHCEILSTRFEKLKMRDAVLRICEIINKN